MTMNWQEAIETVIAKTKHERLRELCDDAHPDHALHRRRVIAKATGKPAEPAEQDACGQTVFHGIEADGMVRTRTSGDKQVQAFPSVTIQAGNAIAAIGRAANAALHGQQVLVDTETKAARLARCNSCRHLKDQRCVLCGCFVDAKAAVATEECPDDPPQWERVSGQPSPHRDGSCGKCGKHAA